MPRRHKPTEADEHVLELLELARDITEDELRLDQKRHRRDELIVKLSEAGMSNVTVAGLAGVSRQRVQQLHQQARRSE